MDVIRAYLNAVANKDASVVDRFFHPDIEYVVNGAAPRDDREGLPPISPECSTALPWLGVYRGREAVKRFLEHMHRNLEITAFGPLDVIADTDKGAAFGWFRLQAQPTGRTADISFAVSFELRDGLISKYRFVENTMDVANAFVVDGSWLVSTDEAEHAVPSLSVRCFTSSEPGAWANSYLIAGKRDAILFDVPMLRNDAAALVNTLDRSGKNLTAVIISHAHPDHFLALERVVERFPFARVVSTQDVVNDVRADAPWMLALIQQKFGDNAPQRIVVPEILEAPQLEIEGKRIDVVQFGEGESKHILTLSVPDLRAMFCADLLYNDAHAYLPEHHLESWLNRLDELEAYVRGRVSVLYPGHGASGGTELIERTRAYLLDFRDATALGSAGAAERRMLEKYPEYHVKQFLTAFSLPAYFPKT